MEKLCTLSTQSLEIYSIGCCQYLTIKFAISALYTSKSGGSTGSTKSIDFIFIYIAHPRAVTHITWRKTSKHMPKGSVCNMLVTSCMDNICRIWVETILPDDGLFNMNQIDPQATQHHKFRTHRHKHRFLQRLRHMKACFHIRRHARNHSRILKNTYIYGELGVEIGNTTIPTLQSTYSVHDFHYCSFNGNTITPSLHFHIASSINAETDIPLVPSIQSSANPQFQPRFTLHWLNNKEMHFSMQAEILLHELAKKSVEKDQDDVKDQHDDLGLESNIFSECMKKQTPVQKRRLHNNDLNEQPSIKLNPQTEIAAPNIISLSKAASANSLTTETITHVPDSLDMKIDCLLRDWHQSPDLLFAIHPIDGSFLIWIVEWLDEYHPSAFRQAQVSFSTRIPNAVPISDAFSMSKNINLYSVESNVYRFDNLYFASGGYNELHSDNDRISIQDKIIENKASPTGNIIEPQTNEVIDKVDNQESGNMK